jgi:uncharacterized membrane protein
MADEQENPELALLHAEADAMEREPAPPAGPRQWLPAFRNGRLVLPEHHHQLMRGVRPGSDLWKRHPHVRTGSQLTFGERAADVMRNAFGSWAFVGGFLSFMALWMILNSLLLRHSGFDKYPYILLNLCLSMMAGLQGALILIAAKRLDRVNAETATAHYAETAKLDALQTANNEMTAHIEEATKLLAEIHRHVTALSPLAGEFAPGEDPPEGG